MVDANYDEDSVKYDGNSDKEENVDEKKDSNKKNEEDSLKKIAIDEYFTVYEVDEQPHKIFRITKRRRGIILAIVAFAVFMSACFWYLDFRARLDLFETALYNGKYVDAQKIYSDFGFREKGEANSMVEDKIIQIDKAYYENKDNSIDFSLKEYRNLSIVDFPKKDTLFYEMVEKFEKLKETHKKYDEAEEAFKKQKYELAIKNYNEVSEQDKDYTTSQEKLQKAVEEYKKEKIGQTEELIQRQKYDEAIEIIDECLRLIPNEEELTNKKKEYLDEKLKIKIDDIKNDAWSYMKNEKYTEAIWVLKNAQREYNNPKEISNKISEYKKSIIEKVEGYAKKNDIIAAVNIINDYLKADPEDTAMQEQLKKYKPSMPKAEALVDMKKTNESGSYYTVERKIEVYGYKNMEKSGQFVVNSDNVSRISGILSYSDNKNVKKGKGRLTIKTANKTETFEMSKNDKMKKIDIEVDAGSKVIFEWDMANSNNKESYGLVLENVYFYK